MVSQMSADHDADAGCHKITMMMLDVSRSRCSCWMSPDYDAHAGYHQITMRQAEDIVLEMLRPVAVEGQNPLAGNTVSMDRRFNSHDISHQDISPLKTSHR